MNIILSYVILFIVHFYLNFFLYLCPYYQIGHTNIPVFDQEFTPSCVANATASWLEYEEQRLGKPILIPSREFIYYNTRLIEGTQMLEVGCWPKDAVASLNIYGWIEESEYPFNGLPIFGEDPPSKDNYISGLNHLGIQSKELQNVTDLKIKEELWKGHSILVGIYCYQLQENNPPFDGFSYVPVPQSWQDSNGGHEILIVGWDDANDAYIFQNSWGEKWGCLGFGEIQKEYILSSNFSDSLYVINTIN